MGLTLPNPQVFPHWVAQHTVTFDLDDPIDVTSHFPGVELPSALAPAVRKRQVEFLAGRFCARQALRACAPEHADVVVGIGPNREPLWPQGIVGAVTHTHGYASVAVARTSLARAIGLDVERVMNVEQAERLHEQIAAHDEVGAITCATGWSFATALTAIFSAKETIFKALYGEVKRHFDFRDAWLEAFDPRENKFRGHLVSTLTASLRAGCALAGRFSLDSAAAPCAVCTGIVLPA
jgi:enterobactin synthetase component D